MPLLGEDVDGVSGNAGKEESSSLAVHERKLTASIVIKQIFFIAPVFLNVIFYKGSRTLFYDLFAIYDINSIYGIVPLGYLDAV